MKYLLFLKVTSSSSLPLPQSHGPWRLFANLYRIYDSHLWNEKWGLDQKLLVDIIYYCSFYIFVLLLLLYICVCDNTPKSTYIHTYIYMEVLPIVFEGFSPKELIAVGLFLCVTNTRRNY